MAKKYVNKSQNYNDMGSRTQLAVIDRNCNVGRGVATITSGDESYNRPYHGFRRHFDG